ncbi:hypothetical protein Sfr7A_06220 [Streptomyces xinghaiensis]|uniref:Uncharacterized protein n=1 Tax=Streptomyces xinghaiensis TaxID=1038928 RepID=A0A3M8FBD1_9ACTN|nr:hypothetical protein Sfr7A_06220 [Streptomyces xinghaiensis]RKM98034.1 hypothetical protein SFRA_005750 [Streptomyces xinghaiensis]RNC75270.1 hypothetical protein DC095_005690 [Streptomyces xinghaiensis]
MTFLLLGRTSPAGGAPGLGWEKCYVLGKESAVSETETCPKPGDHPRATTTGHALAQPPGQDPLRGGYPPVQGRHHPRRPARWGPVPWHRLDAVLRDETERGRSWCISVCHTRGSLLASNEQMTSDGPDGPDPALSVVAVRHGTSGMTGQNRTKERTSLTGSNSEGHHQVLAKCGLRGVEIRTPGNASPAADGSGGCGTRRTPVRGPVRGPDSTAGPDGGRPRESPRRWPPSGPALSPFPPARTRSGARPSGPCPDRARTRA